MLCFEIYNNLLNKVGMTMFLNLYFKLSSVKLNHSFSHTVSTNVATLIASVA
jgi:hypothetical protein